MSYQEGRAAAMQHHQQEGWPIGQFPAPEPGTPDGFLMSKTSEWLKGYRDYYAPIEATRNRQIQQHEEFLRRQGPQLNPEHLERWSERQHRLQTSYDPREGNMLPENCPICMRPMTNSPLPIVVSHCGHYLHDECKNSIFQREKTKRDYPGYIICPTCRDPLHETEFTGLRETNIRPNTSFNIEGNRVRTDVISVGRDNSNTGYDSPPRAQSSRGPIDLTGDDSRAQAPRGPIDLTGDDSRAQASRGPIDLTGDDSAPPRASRSQQQNLIYLDSSDEDPDAMDISGGKRKGKKGKKSRKGKKSNKSNKSKKSRKGKKSRKSRKSRRK